MKIVLVSSFGNYDYFSFRIDEVTRCSGNLVHVASITEVARIIEVVLIENIAMEICRDCR